MSQPVYWIIPAICFEISLMGCAAQRINPAFPVTATEAEHDLKRMAQSPKPLDRPLVIVGGFMDVGSDYFVAEAEV